MIALRLAAVSLTAFAALAAPAAYADENSGGVRAPASQIAPQAAAPSTSVVFYAVTVNADGTLATGPGRIGGIQVVKNTSFTGAYEVTVPGRRNLHRQCHYNATIVSREASVTAAGVAVINSLSGSNNGLYVTTSTVGGTRTDLPFSLTIICNA